MTTIVIDIPQRMPTNNGWINMNRWDRSRFKKALALNVWGACRPPRTPIKRCLVTIERTSTQEPDKDNLYGGMKPLLDVLQPVSRRHPTGLGFIAEDSPACIVDLVIRHVAGKAQRTVVTIEELAPDG